MKLLIWIGLILGSTVGGMLPELWGEHLFSGWSLLLSLVGGFVGIYLGYKLSQ